MLRFIRVCVQLIVFAIAFQCSVLSSSAVSISNGTSGTGALALLERLEGAHDGGKVVDRDVLADEVAVEGLADLVDLALFVLRRRTHHLDDVLHRRLAAERLPEDGLRRAAREPALRQALRSRAERLTAHHARPNDLDEVAQHLSAVDDAREDGRRGAARPWLRGTQPRMPACPSCSRARARRRRSSRRTRATTFDASSSTLSSCSFSFA